LMSYHCNGAGVYSVCQQAGPVLLPPGEVGHPRVMRIRSPERR
jgi:hypothetical protein